MKLAQYQKDQIRAKVVEEKFNPLFADIEQQKQNLALCIVAGMRIAIAGLPEEWFAKRHTLQCGFNDYSVGLPLGSEIPLPNMAHQRMYFDLDSPEYREWHRIYEAEETLELRRKELHAEINAVLKAVPTDKKLEEVWPEALKYLDRAPNLPATTDVSRLKDLLAK